jgi:hypothetical protein
MTTKRVYILVKAYPQASSKYQETVCCAGITEYGEFLRLYPVRYRMLPEEARFDRYDLVEVEGSFPRDDQRPESFHVNETSIRILKRGKGIKPESKAQLWLPHVAPSLEALRAANASSRVSLGIVAPDPGSLRFTWKASSEEDRAVDESMMRQNNLLGEEALAPLDPPEYAFSYRFTSAGKESNCKLHDWEVQAAYRSYKARYSSAALDRLRETYQDRIAQQSPHFFMGTMKAHPTQFIIVGLLRTSADVDTLKKQPPLFS